MTTADLTDMELTTPTSPMMIELEVTPPTGLSVQMQTLAQGYIDARKRAGYAWLDMGRFLSEARAEAKYGEWSVFLEATNTSEDWAKRLIAIYTQSLQNRVFADAMRTNFLSVATGYELISAPPAVQDRLLSSETPPTVKQVREEKRQVANPAPSPTLEEAPAPDLDDILLRLDAHGFAKSGTRQKGITTFYSFRDFGSQLGEDQAGEIELAEGELPYWLQELDYKVARAQERNAQYQDARDRAERLGYDLKRDGVRFILTPSGQKVPALVGTLEAQIKTIAGYEKNAAKKAAADLPPLPSEDDQHRQTIEAILKRPHTLALIQQAYDHAREIHNVDLYNKMIELIDRATDEPEPDHDVSDRQAYAIKEARDAGRIERARSLIEHGEHAAARTVLDQVEVSTRARDQLLATIPVGRSITLALTPDDCAALLKEARMFSSSELTKRLPTIGQTLILLVEAIKGMPVS
jgi:hypothetical protein